LINKLAVFDELKEIDILSKSPWFMIHKQFSTLTERFQKRHIYGWKVVELELGMFIAPQLVWSSSLKMNTWNGLTRQ
jgi:hypothetical protein